MNLKYFDDLCLSFVVFCTNALQLGYQPWAREVLLDVLLALVLQSAFQPAEVTESTRPRQLKNSFDRSRTGVAANGFATRVPGIAVAGSDPADLFREADAIDAPIEAEKNWAELEIRENAFLAKVESSRPRPTTRPSRRAPYSSSIPASSRRGSSRTPPMPA
jgi:hypothetical protein